MVLPAAVSKGSGLYAALGELGVSVFDLEGDHVGLASLGGVVVVGENEPLPSVEHLTRL